MVKNENEPCRGGTGFLIVFIYSNGIASLRSRGKVYKMTSNHKDNKPQGEPEQRENIWQFFRESPLVGLELDFERDTDASRDIEL